MSPPLYTREILRLAASLGEPLPLDRVDGAAERRSATCGSRIAIEVMVENGKVAALSQRVEACAFGQAATALMLAGAPSRSAADVRTALAAISLWLRDDDDTVAEPWPGIAALAPARSRIGRHGAILLPFAALLAAIDAAA